MGELCKAQDLQMTGQSCHHAQQQLGKMLCLDFYVGFLDGLGKMYILDGIIGHVVEGEHDTFNTL